MKLLPRIVFFFSRLKFILTIGLIASYKMFKDRIRRQVKEEWRKFVDNVYTGTEPTE